MNFILKSLGIFVQVKSSLAFNAFIFASRVGTSTCPSCIASGMHLLGISAHKNFFDINEYLYIISHRKKFTTITCSPITIIGACYAHVKDWDVYQRSIKFLILLLFSGLWTLVKFNQVFKYPVDVKSSKAPRRLKFPFSQYASPSRNDFSISF